MGYKTLELTLISANDIKNVSMMGGKMDVYVVVSISGDPNSKQKTPTHQNGGTSPCWNHTLHLNFDEATACYSGWEVVLLLRHDAIGPDKDIGEVRVPIKDLVSGYQLKEQGEPEFATHQVRSKSSGKAKGELKISYRIQDAPAAAQTKAVEPPPPAQMPIGADYAHPPQGAAYAYPGAGAPVGYQQQYEGGYPPQQPGGYGYPAQQPGGYGYPAQQAGGYGYPAQQAGGYGYPAQQPGGYGYPAQQPGGYGYPAQQPGGYGYPAQQPGGYGYPGQEPKKGGGSGLAMGLGVGLVGGAVGGLVVGEMMEDSFDDGGDDDS